MKKTDVYQQIAREVLQAVGGKDNVKQVSHCMTRLRFILNDESIPNKDEIKKIEGVAGVVQSGGQYQVIIGPQVSSVFNELDSMLPSNISEKSEPQETDKKPVKKNFQYYLSAVMGTLAGCMTPLIPVLLCVGILKALVAVLGPQLLGVITEENSLYILFTFVGDAGFYFLPVFVGYTASKKFEMNPLMGMFFGAILVHPALIQMATAKTTFHVYGIPAVAQNYSSTIIPIILTIWIASYVEKFFQKHTPDTLKVFGVPLATLFIMLPLELCLFGPLGSFLGKYICNGIITLYDVAGPVAVAIVAATFGLLVMTGMHTVLMVFLFTTFPTLGYDGFIMPAILCFSWAGAGVTLSCFVKFKDVKKKQLTMSYFITWLLGGVGEPLLYGLNIPYKTPLYASVIAGFISGFLGGILGLKAYVLNPANGIYGLTAFLAGPNRNYIILGIVLVASVVIGFITMWFMKLDENLG
ncbi:PTS transporter subunit EIIC [Lacrimispora sp.]|uniref:PTS transporter subunit EIIC n=1 Tax=Lacrimispora sp. TaxID=2719234 RepID=UPI002896DCD9|nr:PTS transporter subunit EIIC [Lacrimispora sp.]